MNIATVPLSVQPLGGAISWGHLDAVAAGQATRLAPPCLTQMDSPTLDVYLAGTMQNSKNPPPLTRNDLDLIGQRRWRSCALLDCLQFITPSNPDFGFVLGSAIFYAWGTATAPTSYHLHNKLGQLTDSGDNYIRGLHSSLYYHHISDDDWVNPFKIRTLVHRARDAYQREGISFDESSLNEILSWTNTSEARYRRFEQKHPGFLRDFGVMDLSQPNPE